MGQLLLLLCLEKLRKCFLSQYHSKNKYRQTHFFIKHRYKKKRPAYQKGRVPNVIGLPLMDALPLLENSWSQSQND